MFLHLITGVDFQFIIQTFDIFKYTNVQKLSVCYQKINLFHSVTPFVFFIAALFKLQQ